jgi:hypothetical protein
VVHRLIESACVTHRWHIDCLNFGCLRICHDTIVSLGGGGHSSLSGRIRFRAGFGESTGICTLEDRLERNRVSADCVDRGERIIAMLNNCVYSAYI